MALDGTKWDVPDTPANARAFGRPASGAGTSAWPQVQVVALTECGTHAVCDAGVWRHDASEHAGARRLLRSVGPGMLLTWDRGLHSFDLVAATRARRAHLLGRLPAGVQPGGGPAAGRRHPAGAPAARRLRPPPGRRARCWCGSSRTRWTTRPGPGTGRSTASSPRCSTRAPPRPGRWSRPTTPAGRRRWPSTSWRRTSAPRAPCAAGRRWGVLQEVYGLLLAHYVVRAVMADAAATGPRRPLPPTRLSVPPSLVCLSDACPPGTCVEYEAIGRRDPSPAAGKRRPYGRGAVDRDGEDGVASVNLPGKLSRKSFLGGLAAAMAGTGVLAACGPESRPSGSGSGSAGGAGDGDVIKVGILHSLSGTMAISEKSGARRRAAGDRGDQRGRRRDEEALEPVIEDGASDWPTFAEKAKKLIQSDKVATVFGCWTSASRKAVLPVFESLKGLLWYPVQYEGLEASPNIFYTGRDHQPADRPGGRVPARGGEQDEVVPPGLGLRLPAHGERDHQGPARPRSSATLAGEEYTPLGHTDYSTVITKILSANPDVVFNTLNGDSNVAFFKQFKDAGITADKIQTLSVSVAEEEVRGIGRPTMEGHLSPGTTTRPRTRRRTRSSSRPTRRSSAPTASPTTRSRPATSASTSGQGRREGRLDRRRQGQGGGQGPGVRRARGHGQDQRAEPAHLQDGAHRQGPRRRPDRRDLEHRQAGRARPVPGDLRLGGEFAEEKKRPAASGEAGRDRACHLSREDAADRTSAARKPSTP